MKENVLVNVKDVSMNYGAGRQDAVEHVSLEIMKGEILAVVGSNGSGKSTLMKGILKLMPITCGEIERKKGLRTAYLAQIHTTERDFPANVREIVLSGTRLGRFSPFYGAKQRKMAQEAMKLMDIEDLARNNIGLLSGGQLQRTLLARAIAGEPELLVLDEPCSALDPAITHDLYHLFTKLRDEKGVSIVIATHDWDFVREHADRVLVLDRHVEYYGNISGWSGMEAQHTCHH
ncbi:MAG: ATP-binding cassette domain-containing protein [Clostridia bacterium]|nr:ATP-binding cassette domain-containing protein [Clostridia bacterium]